MYTCVYMICNLSHTLVSSGQVRERQSKRDEAAMMMIIQLIMILCDNDTIVYYCY